MPHVSNKQVELLRQNPFYWNQALNNNLEEAGTYGSVFPDASLSSGDYDAGLYLTDSEEEKGSSLDLNDQQAAVGSDPFANVDASVALNLFKSLDTDGNDELSDGELSSFSGVVGTVNATVDQLKSFFSGLGLKLSSRDQSSNDKSEDSDVVENEIKTSDLIDATRKDFKKIAKQSGELWNDIDKAGLKNVFEMLDTNGDGKLDESELSAVSSLDGDKETISSQDLKQLFEKNNIKTDEKNEDKAEEVKEKSEPAKANNTQETQKQTSTPAANSVGGSGAASGNNGVSGGSSSSAQSQPSGLNAMSLSELEAEKTSRESKMNEKQQAVSDVHNGNNAAVKSAKDDEDKAKADYQEKLEKDSKVSPELKEKETKNIQALDKNQTAIDKANSDISNKENEIFSQETKLTSLNSALSSLQGSLSSLPAPSGKDEDKEKDAQIAEKKSSIESQISSKKSEISKEENQHKKAQNELKELKTSLTDLEKEKTDLEKEKTRIEAEILKNCSEETKEALQTYNQARQNVETVKQQELQKAQSDLSSAQKDVQEVSAKITEVKNKETAKENGVSGSGDDVIDFAKQFDGMSADEIRKVFAEKGYQFDAGAWCADFVSMSLGETVGENVPDWYKNCGNKAYCPTIDAAGRQAGANVSIQDAKPGDLVLFDWDGNGSPNHIGILVDSGDGQTIKTIEGNTGDDNGNYNNAGGGGYVNLQDRNMSTVMTILSMS